MKFLISVLYIAALGIASHFVGEALPRAWFKYDAFPYAGYKWEKDGRAYEKLGIRRWKDILPDMSKIMPDMVKKKMPAGNDSASMFRLVAETCVAEAVHAALTALSFAVLLWWSGGWAWTAIIVYNLLGNIPFIIIQRYNRPRLVLLAQRRRKREGAAA